MPVPQVSGLMPCPPPFPAAENCIPQRASPTRKIEMVLNVIVAWPPGCRVGDVLSRAQREMVERFAGNVGPWSRCPKVAVAELSRYALKLEQAEDVLTSLLKQAETLRVELNSYPGARPPSLHRQASRNRDPDTKVIGVLRARPTAAACRPSSPLG